MGKTWLVYSREHNGWWRSNRCGYIDEIAFAGRYTKTEADEICARALPTAWCDGLRGVPEFAMPEPS